MCIDMSQPSLQSRSFQSLPRENIRWHESRCLLVESFLRESKDDVRVDTTPTRRRNGKNVTLHQRRLLHSQVNR